MVTLLKLDVYRSPTVLVSSDRLIPTRRNVCLVDTMVMANRSNLSGVDTKPADGGTLAKYTKVKRKSVASDRNESGLITRPPSFAVVLSGINIEPIGGGRSLECLPLLSCE